MRLFRDPVPPVRGERLHRDGENPDGNNEVNMTEETTEAEDNNSEIPETSEETVPEEECSEISPELSEIMEKYAAYSDKDKKEQDTLPGEDDISDKYADETDKKNAEKKAAEDLYSVL